MMNKLTGRKLGLIAYCAQTESELRAEISMIIFKVQRSGNTSRGTVTRFTTFVRSTHAH